MGNQLRRTKGNLEGGGSRDSQTAQALGVDWNTESDTLSVDSRDILDKTTKGPASKRQLLQTTVRYYDSLGLFSPASAIGKLLFQGIWCRGLQWGEILSHDIGARWHLIYRASTFLVGWEPQTVTTLRSTFCVTHPKGLIERSCTLDLLHGRAL